MASLAKVLVPLDGTALSEHILEATDPLLRRPGTKVTLVRVVPPRRRTSPTGETPEQSLYAIRDRLRDKGIDADAELLIGSVPATRILEHADEHGFSVVALATHGRTGLARLVRGSVAERLLRTSEIPLLLVNPFDERYPHKFEKILVPHDGSDGSNGILQLVTDLARAFESSITLLHVVNMEAFDASGRIDPGPTLREAAAAMAVVARELNLPRVTADAVLGSPADTILETARDGSYDLIAMTTHGRTGLSHWAFGSVAEDLVRTAPCPVLVVRTPASDPERGG